MGSVIGLFQNPHPHDRTHAGKSHGRGGGGGVNDFGNPDGRGALNLNSIQFNSIQFNSIPLFTLYKIFTKVYVVGK